MTTLTQNLCSLLTNEKNSYGMKALYRVVSFGSDHLVKLGADVGSLLNQYVASSMTEQDQGDCSYTYVLFETIGLFATQLGKAGQIEVLSQ